MLTVFKNILKHLKAEEPLKSDLVENRELVGKIEELLKTDDLKKITSNPVNRLIVINTYTNSFSDLLSNLVNRNVNRQIIAVNLNSYLKNNFDSLSRDLGRVASILKDSKINIQIESDLYELIDTLLNLRS